MSSIAAPASRGFPVSTISLDESITAYSQAQQETLRYWFHLAKDKGWSLGDLSKQTGVSTTTLSRVYRNLYGADASAVIARLEKARETFIHAADNPDFIMSSLGKVMWTAFDKTRALKNVTIMWGIKGIGKTTVSEEYAHQHNHGHTFYVRCLGSGCTVQQFIRHVAASMHITNAGHQLLTLRSNIISYLARGQRLLIIDELHEIFLTCGNRSVIQICEFLRELSDVANCGLVLIGTEELHHQFFKGEHKHVLAQLLDRGTVQINLRDKPTKGDVSAFLRHYNLALPGEGEPAAATILNDILGSSGLRKLTLHLRDGQAHANKLGEAYTWSHFVAAFDAIQSLSR